MYTKKINNEDQLSFLKQVIEENKTNNKKQSLLYYTVYVMKFGGKVPVLYREPNTTDIEGQIKGYKEKFSPDFIIVDLFTGKSRNVKSPLASFKFDYRNKF